MEQNQAMQYRRFGNTGASVSALGFGCMRLPTTDGKPSSGAIDEAESIRIIRAAIDGGVNYIDTAYFYHQGFSESLVGKALQDGYRERVYIATKSPLISIKETADFQRILDEQLAHLQTDCIDFYLLHAVSRKRWEETVLPLGLLEQLKQAKASGKVKHIGFSFHDNYDTFKMVLDAFDGWDFCQIQMNYIDVDSQAELRGMEYAAAKGLGVIAMEPLLGGALAAPSAAFAAALPAGKTPVEWALDFLWNRPEISLLLSGMSNMQQVEENLVYAGRSQVGMLSAAEQQALAQAKKEYDSLVLVPCTGCAYCMPCPAGINIPAVYEIYNATASSTMERASGMYGRQKVQADACVACKKCEQACPQKIASTELMPKIARTFAK